MEGLSFDPLDASELMGYNMGIIFSPRRPAMSRTAVIKKPVRLHLTLEKKTLDRLKKLYHSRSKTVTETIRDLAESYAEGRVELKPKSIHDVLEEIRRMRDSLPPSKERSQDIIRRMRDA